MPFGFHSGLVLVAVIEIVGSTWDLHQEVIKWQSEEEERGTAQKRETAQRGEEITPTSPQRRRKYASTAQDAIPNCAPSLVKTPGARAAIC